MAYLFQVNFVLITKLLGSVESTVFSFILFHKEKKLFLKYVLVLYVAGLLD